MANKQSILEVQTVDFIGILAGMLCAVHCLLSVTSPILISLLGVGSLFSHTAEIIFVLFGVMTAGFTILFGTSNHTTSKVRLMLLLGIITILSAQYLEVTSGHHEEGHDISNTMINSTESVTYHHEATPLIMAHTDHNIHPITANSVHETKHNHSSLPIFMSILGGLLIIFGHFYNLRNQRFSTEIYK